MAEESIVIDFNGYFMPRFGCILGPGRLSRRFRVPQFYRNRPSSKRANCLVEDGGGGQRVVECDPAPLLEPDFRHVEHRPKQTEAPELISKVVCVHGYPTRNIEPARAVNRDA